MHNKYHYHQARSMDFPSAVPQSPTDTRVRRASSSSPTRSPSHPNTARLMISSRLAQGNSFSATSTGSPPNKTLSPSPNQLLWPSTRREPCSSSRTECSSQFRSKHPSSPPSPNSSSQSTPHTTTTSTRLLRLETSAKSPSKLHQFSKRRATRNLQKATQSPKSRFSPSSTTTHPQRRRPSNPAKS